MISFAYCVQVIGHYMGSSLVFCGQPNDYPSTREAQGGMAVCSVLSVSGLLILINLRNSEYETNVRLAVGPGVANTLALK